MYKSGGGDRKYLVHVADKLPLVKKNLAGHDFPVLNTDLRNAQRAVDKGTYGTKDDVKR